MKVNILIPTYNQDKYIQKAVRSALSQSYHNLKVIVSDDQSTDNTEEVLRPFYSDSRFTYTKTPQRLGMIGNYRHMLYQLADGDWAINLDGDDYFTSDFVGNFVSEIKQHSNIKWIMGGQQHVDEQGQLLHRFPTFSLKDKAAFLQYDEDSKFALLSGKKYVLNYLVNNWFFAHSSTFYHVESAKQVRYYQAKTNNSDELSILKLALQGDVLLYQPVIMAWRQHQGNVSAQFSVEGIERNFQLLKELINEQDHHFSSSEMKKMLRSNQQKLNRYLLDYWRANNPKKGLNYILNGRATDLKSLKALPMLVVEWIKGSN